MLNAQIPEAVLKLLRHHRTAPVAHQRARQPPFHERLLKSVHQIFGVLDQVPLGMKTHAAVIVERCKALGPMPSAVCIRHPETPVVKIQMTERPHMGRLEAPHLSLLQSLDGLDLPWRGMLRALLLRPSQGFHPPAQSRIRRHLSVFLRIPLGNDRKILVMQIVPPPRMQLVLSLQGCGQFRPQRPALSEIPAYRRPQRINGIVALFRLVVPRLDGGKSKAHRLPALRVNPRFQSKLPQRVLQFSGLRRTAQKPAHHRKAQLGPSMTQHLLLFPFHKTSFAPDSPSRWIFTPSTG